METKYVVKDSFGYTLKVFKTYDDAELYRDWYISFFGCDRHPPYIEEL